MRRLQELESIGRDPQGGVNRFAFTSAYTEACLRIANWMREAGLDPFLDHAGNLIGALAVVAFADEEGFSFGIGCLTSRALVGELSLERTGVSHGI